MALNSGGRSSGGVAGMGYVGTGDKRSIAQWKTFFFDRPAVLRAAGRAKTTALSRFGGYIRSVARRSMRRRKGDTPSPAGQPPFARSGELRDLLFFAYDHKTRTVVVGPLGFSGSDVPHLHEFGGSVNGDGRVLYLKNSPGRDEAGRFVSKGLRRVRLKGDVKYPARPYMKPALDKSVPVFAAMFRGLMSR